MNDFYTILEILIRVLLENNQLFFNFIPEVLIKILYLI